MRFARLATTSVAVSVGAALGGALLPMQAADADGGRCAAGTGVTVVVDYASLGRGVEIGCDPDGAGDPASDVVPAAGFPLTYVSGEAFVCRIDGLPDESQESCARTPPEDAYWALYWSDGTSDTWKYSSSGVTGLKVPEGGSIGWRFQDGGARETPSAPPTTAGESASPSPSKSPSPQPSKSPTHQPSGHSDAADPTPTPEPTPSASVPPGTHGSGSTPGEGARPGDKGSEPRPERQDTKGKQGKGKQGNGKHDKGGHGHQRDREKAHPEQAGPPSPSPTAAAITPASGEPTDEDSSSAVLTLVAGGAVLALAAAAGVIAWRRRV